MDHDFMKRGYLLPAGCKDLIDVLKTSKHPNGVLKTPQCAKHPMITLPVLPPGGPSGVPANAPASAIPKQHTNPVLKHFASKVPKQHAWWQFWKS